MRTIIRPKDRAEWLRYRQSGIGSSEVATIVGLNPWETPYQLWRRKMGLDEAKEETFAMRAGHYLEDAVARFWQDDTGHTVIKSSAGDWLIVNSDKEFMRVSPDRTYWLKDMPHNDMNKGILECKTTQASIDADNIPKHWFCQLQYQLGVAEMQHGSLAWLCAGREFGYKHLNFVPEFFAWLEEEVTRFWCDNILRQQAPDATDVADAVLMYSRHVEGKAVEVDADIMAACMKLKEVRDQLDRIEARKTELESKIKMVFGDAEAISHAGTMLATWKAPKPSRKLDIKALEAAHPDIAERFYTSQQGARRLALK